MAKYPGSFIINEVGTRKELASIYGVSERTIYRWLNKAAKESGLSPKVSKKTHPRDTTLANFKGTRKQLAKKYGVSERTAYRWLEKAKARGTDIPSRRSESKYPGAAVMMNIITTSAKTDKQIADELGVSPRTASKWIRRAKMEIPSLVPDLRKTGQYKLRRKKTANGNWYSWYEYVGDNAAEEPKEPEDVFEQDPFFVPEEQFNEQAEDPFEEIGEPFEVEENETIDDEWNTANLSQLHDLLAWGDEPLLDPSSKFYNIPMDQRLAYLDEYLKYQYRADEHQFYDEQLRRMVYDPDDPSLFTGDRIMSIDIWGDEFEEWLEWQDEVKTIQL